MGVIYEAGKGVGQYYIEAAKWYIKSAKQGYAPTQYNLGQLYEFGNGVNKDLAEAAIWYQKGAKQGHENAMKRLENIRL